MPTDPKAPIESRRARLQREYLQMARHAQGRDWADWPGWSTGETLMVALILDRLDVLHALGFTMLEAIERADSLSHCELRAIAREVAA